LLARSEQIAHLLSGFVRSKAGPDQTMRHQAGQVASLASVLRPGTLFP
jgi:hypothetical protein